METLLNWLRENPAVFHGFLGGLVGAIVVNTIHWRWRITRREHPKDD